MIHFMLKATIRDLRTRFPEVRTLVEREGEVVITHRGRAILVLRPFVEPRRRAPKKIDYYRRLCEYMPKPMSAADSRALDEENRADR